MAVTGRKPNPDAQRRNRSTPAHNWTEVEDRPFEEAPGLPRAQPGRPWPAPTKKWWSAISRMPHCVLWAESDWQFALDTALLVASFHSGELQRAQEIRMREKIMGTTADARRDLRIRYVDSSTSSDEPAFVTAIADYRKRLT